MNGELFGLAVQGIVRKKRSSLLLFAVLLLSFAFAVISLSVTASIRKTNEEYRYDTYGTWYGAIRNGRTSDAEFLQGQEWLDKLGICISYGEIQASSGSSIGTMDDTFLEIGRIALQDGRFPKNANEIAMEADLLSALGYDYTVGQEITVTVDLPAVAYINAPDEPEIQSITVPVEQSYTLCGVIREYANLWVQGGSSFKQQSLNSAMILPETANALLQLAEEATEALREDMNAAMEYGEVTSINVDTAVVPQYYFSVFPGLESTAVEQANQYLYNTRSEDDSGDLQITINIFAFSANAQDEIIETFFAALILVVTLLSVVCIYVIRIQDEAQQLATFRSIGITKKQLCLMLMYETLCLGVPAMLIGAGMGALGVWALLRLAVYSGSASIQVVVPPYLLASAAALWLLGVLAVRLAVFLVALHAPLTGRFHVARKKAKLYRSLRRILIGGLSVLLCAAVLFTALESLEPLRRILYLSSLSDYIVTPNVKGHLPNALHWFAGGYEPNYDHWFPGDRKDEYMDPNITVPKDAVAPFSQIPGVTHSWGWGEEYVRLDFEGMKDTPLAVALMDYIDSISDIPGKQLPYGVGAYDPDAMAVYLVVVDEGDWEGIIDFNIDMDKFKSGEEVLMSFSLSSSGRFIAAYDGRSDMEEYEDTGLSVGDTIRITAGSPKVYGTVEAQVGGIVSYSTEVNTGGIFGFSRSYTVICSEAFLEKLLDAIGPGEVWHEFTQGTPYGYEQVYVYTDQNAEYLSTDAVLAELCVRENLKLNAEIREMKRAFIQESMQTLILLLTGGCCAALVLLLILGNALSMEAERQKRNIGILQALGMSRRQLRFKQLGTAALRGVLGALGGWLAYGGYCVSYALHEQERLQMEEGTVYKLIEEKISLIVQYWGDWQVILPLTLLCIVIILLVSRIAKRRLTHDDLMAKLRDER